MNNNCITTTLNAIQAKTPIKSSVSFFPKGTDFRKISQQELNKAQYLINDRPKKKLGFSTPKIEFYKMIN